MFRRPFLALVAACVIARGTTPARAAASATVPPAATTEALAIGDDVAQAIHLDGDLREDVWRRAPVLGLGVGAHSSEPAAAGAPFGARAANERSLAAWLARIEAGGGATPPEREAPPAATARGEAAFLALRTRAGLDAAQFAAEFGAVPRQFFAEAIDALLALGLVSESAAGDLRPTERSWLFADTVATHFVAAPVDSAQGA